MAARHRTGKAHMTPPATPELPPSRRPYDGPPDYRVVGRHGIYPETSHDEIARFNFLAHMNRHLSTHLMPGVAEAFEARVKPAFESLEGRSFEDRHEVRKALSRDPSWQWWSMLRRATMETRQQAGRWVTLRQAESLNEKVRIFNDGGGVAVAEWVAKNLPDFKPRRILDIGCGLGHNVLPIAAAFPDAEVIGVDAGAPMLRYGLARAKSMGIGNVTFVQADVADLSRFENESFDWIQSTMFLHETSYKTMPVIFAETNRLLKPGGIVLHVEQPQYTEDMPLFEQAMRDWDAFYNNEPFWTKLHEVDLDDWMAKSGFPRQTILHGGVTAVVDPEVFPEAAKDTKQEDYGRKAAWHVIGAWKAA